MQLGYSKVISDNVVDALELYQNYFFSHYGRIWVMKKE